MQQLSNNFTENNVHRFVPLLPVFSVQSRDVLELDPLGVDVGHAEVAGEQGVLAGRLFLSHLYLVAAGLY